MKTISSVFIRCPLLCGKSEFFHSPKYKCEVCAAFFRRLLGREPASRVHMIVSDVPFVGSTPVNITDEAFISVGEYQTTMLEPACEVYREYFGHCQTVHVKVE